MSISYYNYIKMILTVNTMQISYDYYKIFYHVARTKSFTKAARIMGNSQPNITRAIKNLEHAIGCPLLTRNSRSVALTPEGEKLYAHVSIAFEHLEMAEREILMDCSLESGTVTIGANEVALHCLLLPVLRRFRQLYPGVHIQVTNYSTPMAISSLRNNLTDLTVVTTPMTDTSGLIEKQIKPFSEVAVCGDAFPELFDQTLSLRDLLSYPLIALGNGTMTYEFYADLFAGLGLPYSPSVDVAAAHQILPMVQFDLGIGFVPESFIKEADHVHILSLKESIPQRQICLLKRKDHSLNIAARELERLIRGL